MGAQSQEDTAHITDMLGNRKGKWQQNEWVDYCKEVRFKESVLCKNLVLHRPGFLLRTNHSSVNTFGSFHYYLIPLSGLESKTSSCHGRFVEAWVLPYTFTFICSLSVICYCRIIAVAYNWVRLTVVEIHLFSYLIVMQFLIREFFQTD